MIDLKRYLWILWYNMYIFVVHQCRTGPHLRQRPGHDFQGPALTAAPRTGSCHKAGILLALACCCPSPALALRMRIEQRNEGQVFEFKYYAWQYAVTALWSPEPLSGLTSLSRQTASGAEKKCACASLPLASRPRSGVEELGTRPCMASSPPPSPPPPLPPAITTLLLWGSCDATERLHILQVLAR